MDVIYQDKGISCENGMIIVHEDDYEDEDEDEEESNDENVHSKVVKDTNYFPNTDNLESNADIQVLDNQAMDKKKIFDLESIRNDEEIIGEDETRN